MQVIVIGSGVVGTTAAHSLAQAGAEVTVLERRPAAGLETSYANAGQVSTGYSSPWAAPGVPFKALKWLTSEHSPLRIRPRPDPAMLRFLLAMLRNCTRARYAVNKERMLRLAEYSRICFGRLREQTGIHYDEGTQGTLVLYRTAHQFEDAARDMELVAASGLPCELLERDACVRVEPALAAVAEKIVGGMRLPQDETGDCFLFTQALAQIAAAAGVKFRYGVQVRSLVTERGRVLGVETDQGRVSADACVIAAANDSVALLRPLGIALPIYPVKGYSLTVPVTRSEAAPVSTVMDETYKVALTRLGTRIRVAGTAELAGFDESRRPERFRTVRHVLQDLFPQGGDLSRAEYWSGLRPMTPDGPPVIGATPYANLFLNTGHGSLGWTMSCGSARLITDLVLGRPPEIDPSGLSLERYHSS